MTPRQELEFLSNFIQLSKNEAVKRDCLERFLSHDSFDLLIDADSIVYNVAHFWLGKELIYSDMIEDFHSQVRAIALGIEEQGYPVNDIRTFFTTCTNNFRLEFSKDYKGNRERNELSELVYDLKRQVIENIEFSFGDFCEYNDELEADDLIPLYIKNRGKGNEIIVSIDKDLKQITGCHFDYYKQKTGDVDEWNNPIKVYKGFTFTSPSEGTELLGRLLLEGDAVDNIKGVKGIGKVKAKKLLKDRSEYGKFRRVVESYIKEGGEWKEKLTINYHLINLIK